jgi:hypothetical protein
MPVFAAKPFAPFVFKNDDLFGLALFHDVPLNRNTIEYRLTDADVFSVRKHQYPVKRHGAANIPGNLFNF